MKKRISIVALIVSVSMSLCSCGLAKNIVKTAIKNSKKETVEATEVETESELEETEIEVVEEIETKDYSEYECEYIDYELYGISFAIPSEYILTEEKDDQMCFLKNDEGYIMVSVSEEYDENVKSEMTPYKFKKIVTDNIDEILNYDKVETLDEGLNDLDNIYVYNHTLSISDDNDGIKNVTAYISCIYIFDINRIVLYIHTVDDDKYDNDMAYYEAVSVLGSIVEPYLDEDSISSDNSTSKLSTDGVSPELVEFLDQYEDITDEYMEYMASIASGNFNVGDLLSGYSDIISEYEEFSKKADAYDTSNMSEADSMYYTKRMLEITSKMYSSIGQFQNK